MTLTDKSLLLPSLKKNPLPQELDMRRIVCIILGGGKGTRLSPLTLSRCKPAISFGGRYRLIDVPISNALNSGCNQIFIITQFLSTTLHQHIQRTYPNDPISKRLIEFLTVEQKNTHSSWYKGTADAVRQNMEHLLEFPSDYYLILSGDQLYQMDFKKMFHFALSTDADAVLAALPIGEQEAKRMGILKIDRSSFIQQFQEKPQDQEVLKQFHVPHPFQPKSQGSKREKTYLGSMGIYLFKREALLRCLHEEQDDDFGNHIIPKLVSEKRVAAYLHQGYWEDIGTIDSFYKANMALTEPHPAFDCFSESHPIFTTPTLHPPARIFNTHIHQAIICDGSHIQAKEITRSIIGPQTRIQTGCIIRDSYIMGNFSNSRHSSIGENCVILNAILDKNVTLGNGVQLVNKKELTHYDGGNVFIRDGIIVVPKGAVLPYGFSL